MKTRVIRKAAISPPRSRAMTRELHAVAARSIPSLDLVDSARDAATQLLLQCPTVIFTSGRRNVNQQASAMAGNVVRNRKWIEQTYLASPERDALQAWVDANPAAVTAPAIAAGLAGIMTGWTDAQRKKLSKHFSGQAFDIQPVAGPQGNAIKGAIRALPNLRKFLENEGGLIIWHAEFEKR